MNFTIKHIKKCTIFRPKKQKTNLLQTSEKILESLISLKHNICYIKLLSNNLNTSAKMSLKYKSQLLIMISCSSLKN